jgi:hypothetical protein
LFSPKERKIVFKPEKAKFSLICTGNKFINFLVKMHYKSSGKTTTVGTVEQRWSILLEYNFCFFICTNDSGRGKFMPLPLKSKILETPGFLVTDYIKMFPL